MLRRLPTLFLITLFVLAFLLRVTDLKDEPLDFNPSRQLYSAIIARALYYNTLPNADPSLRDTALAHRNSLERLEPPLLETLAVLAYHFAGGEKLWIPRLITILFWLVGGVVVFGLAGGMMTSDGPSPNPLTEGEGFFPPSPSGRGAGGEGARAVSKLLPLAYYLFLPLAVYGSRAFQPDPGMVMFILLFAWALLRWDASPTWKWTVIAGVLGGLAILTKAVATFFLGGMAVGIVLIHQPNPRSPIPDHQSPIPNPRSPIPNLQSLLSSPQLWLLVALLLLPPAAYYLTQTGGNESLFTRTVFNRWREVVDPSFYLRWLIILDRLMELPIVCASLIGVWLAPRRERGLLLGGWAGYALYGLMFPRLIITHDYYHLPLIPLVALSLAPLVGVVWARLNGTAPRLGVIALTLLLIGYHGWVTRSVLVAQDFRGAPAYWEVVGQAIPPTGRVVGYTQDYGFRLMYYGWRRVDVLPEQIGVDKFLAEVEGADYFVVTAKNQMSEAVAAYAEANFAVLVEGGGFVVYDLQP